MAEQHIGRTGTITITSDSYGWGSISGPATPPEDPSKWHSTLVDAPWICKRYDWTNDDLNASVSTRGGRYSFPASCKQTPVAGTALRSGYTKHEWKLEALLEWEGRIRALAAKLPKK
jgi:hypothetical protein